MAITLDIEDPFEKKQPIPGGIKLDIEDPFGERPALAPSVPPPDMGKSVPVSALEIPKAETGTVLGGPGDILTGIFKGVTEELPEQAGLIKRFFTGEAPPTPPTRALPEEKPSVFEQAGRMIPSSYLPALLRVGGAALTPFAPYVGLPMIAAGMAAPAAYGVAQTQADIEEAKRRGVKPGIAPYVSGITEWLGETLGTKYLTKMFKVLKPVAKGTLKEAIRPTLGKFLAEIPKTMAVETGTEFGQQFIQSTAGKLGGYRPEAEPLQEAMGVVAPTAIMTALGVPAGRMTTRRVGEMWARDLEDPTKPETNRLNTVMQVSRELAESVSPEISKSWTNYAVTQVKGGLPIDLTQELGTEGIEREGAAITPLTEAESLKRGPTAPQGKGKLPGFEELGAIFGPQIPGQPSGLDIFKEDLWNKSPEEITKSLNIAQGNLNTFLQTGAATQKQLIETLRKVGRDKIRRAEITGQLETLGKKMEEAQDLLGRGATDALLKIGARAEEEMKKAGLKDADIAPFMGTLLDTIRGKNQADLARPVKDVVSDMIKSSGVTGVSSAGALPTGTPSAPSPEAPSLRIQREASKSFEAARKEAHQEAKDAFEKFAQEKYPTQWKEALEIERRTMEEKQPLLDKEGQAIVANIPGAKWFGIAKSAKSLMEKMIRKIAAGKQYDLYSPKDHARGSIYVEKWEDAPKAIEELRNRGFEIEDTIFNPLNHFGYRGINAVKALGDKFNGEIQIHTKESWALKMKSDEIYWAWRNYTDKDLGQLTPEEELLYKKDFEKSTSMWRDYWEKIPLATRESISASVRGTASVTAPTLTGGVAERAGAQGPLPSPTMMGESPGGAQTSLPSAIRETEPTEAPLPGIAEPPSETKIPEPGKEVKPSISKEWTGKAYRSETGYKHDPGTTVADVIRFEEEDLGNDLGVTDEAKKKFGNLPASEVLWVTRTREEAERYGGPEELDLPPGSTIIGEDGEGGFLVVKGQAPAETPEAKREAFRKDVAERKTKRDTHVKANLDAAGDADAVRFTSEAGHSAIVHRNPGYQEEDLRNPWRVTFIDDQGPWGHELFKSREDAIRSLSGEMTDSGPATGHVGQWTVAETMKGVKKEVAPDLEAMIDQFEADVAEGVPLSIDMAKRILKIDAQTAAKVVDGLKARQKEGIIGQEASETEVPPLSDATAAVTITPGQFPEKGVVENFPVNEIFFDPENLQYKIEKRAEKGTTGSLAGARTFDRNLFGVISIWKNPADGKHYVVNGHNRLDFAINQGVTDVPVRILDPAIVKTVEDARSMGALTNIAEGQGTAIDAAKFFRDSKLTEEQLRDLGISFTKGLQKDAVALSNLDEWLFKSVINKTFPIERAIIIGGKVKDFDLQKEVIRAVEAREKKGTKITNDIVQEVVDQVASSPVKEAVQQDLFGTTTTKKSLVFEKAEISAFIKKELSRDKKIFAVVARNAEELKRVPGQEIRAKESLDIAKDSAKLLDIFDRLKNFKGPVGDIITESAERLAGGEDAKTVKEAAYERIREALPTAITGQGQGIREGTEGIPGEPPVGPEGAPEAPTLFQISGAGTRIPSGPGPTQVDRGKLQDTISKVLSILPKGSVIGLRSKIIIDLKKETNRKALEYWIGKPTGDVPPLLFYEQEMAGKRVTAVHVLNRELLASWIDIATEGRPLEQIERSVWHEAWHGVSEYFLSDEQRKILEAKYPAAGAMNTQEIQAEAFADWVIGKRKAVPSSVKQVFEAVKDFFARIKNWARGLGFESGNEIFGKAFMAELPGQIVSRNIGREHYSEQWTRRNPEMEKFHHERYQQLLRDNRLTPEQRKEIDMMAQIGPLFHGTGMEFDRFSTEAVGKGQGAQTFGWGLYFTDQESIARWYAKTIGDAKFSNVAERIGEKASLPRGRRKLIQGWIDVLLARQGVPVGTTIFYPLNAGNVSYKNTFSQADEAEYQRIYKKMIEDPFRVGQEERKTLQDLGLKRPNPNGYKWYTESEFNNALRDITRYIHESGPFPTWLMGQPYNFLKESVQEAFAGIPTEPTHIIKKVLLHEGRSPDEYHYLKWDETVTDAQRKKIADAWAKHWGVEGEFNAWKDLVATLRREEVPKGWTLKEGIGAKTGQTFWQLFDENGEEVPNSGSSYDKKGVFHWAERYARTLIHRTQPPGIQMDVSGILSTLSDPTAAPGGSWLYGALETRFQNYDYEMSGGAVRERKPARDASMFLLKEAGIDGIQYPSGTITGQDTGGSNYVVFNDQAITPMGETRFQVSPTEFASTNPNVERQWQENKGFDTVPQLEKVKEAALKIKQSLFEHFPLLADNRKFGKVKDILRRAETIPEKSLTWANQQLQNILRDLDSGEYYGFSKLIILEDLMKDHQTGLINVDQDHQFGYNSYAEVEADYNNFLGRVTPKMQDALDKRADLLHARVNQAVNLKILPDSVLNDERYYHHQVMEYMNLKYYGPRVSSEDLRTHRKGWMIKRVGSEKPYNTEYIQAEYEFLAQLKAMIDTKLALDEVENNQDISDRVKADARARGISDWKKAIPDGYTVWQPVKGNIFYRTFSLTDRVVDQVLNQGRPLSWDDLKIVLAMGGKRKEWVIPQELARTLDEFRNFRSENIVMKAADSVLTSWKQWILLNPLRVLKYWINNMSGDMDISLAYDPKIIIGKKGPSTYLKDAFTELLAEYRGKPLSQVQRDSLTMARSLDVLGSGITVKEIPDINEAGIFKGLVGSHPGFVSRYWTGVKEFNNFRENILRLAAFKYFRERLARGDKVYGASRPEEVDAVTDLDHRAAKLARELIGDYGNISEAGQWLRKHLIPFYSWIEINAPRYVRLIKNVKYEGAGPQGRAGRALALGGLRLGVQATLLYTLVNLWNRSFFPDEDDEMQKAERNQLHLILGRRDDGSIISLRFQGALSDALNWFGMEDFPREFKEVVSGKVPLSKKIGEMTKAPIQKLLSGARPFEKGVVEALTGRTLYPEMFKPRPIRDKAEHIFKTFALDLPYRYGSHYLSKAGITSAGRPVKGAVQDIASLITYRSEPGESAYYSTIQNISDWLEEQGYEVPTISPTKRSNALYYHKQATRFGDKEEAKKWLDEYIRLGGKTKDIRNSFKKSHPVSFVPLKLRRQWLASLDEEDKKTLDVAVKWWEKTYSQ